MFERKNVNKAEIKTIYDVIVCMYLILKAYGEEVYLQRYFDEFISDQKMLEERSEILSYLRNTVINKLFSPLQIYEFLEFKMEEKTEMAPFYCIFVMLQFDLLLLRQESERHGLDTIIPYDKLSTIDSEWTYVPIFRDNFIMDGAVMDQVRDKKINKGVWQYIKNYKVIGHSNMQDYEIYIDRYNVDWIKNQKNKQVKRSLKIAMVPFSRKNMFVELQNGVKEYTPYENEEYVYKCCISLLEKLERESVDIVVFPELVMTLELKDRIRKWLNKKFGAQSNTKLIFLGSYYENNVNRCALLAGNGRQLLTNDKRNAFEYRDSHGNIHREKLGNFSKIITMMDISGLGRIYYDICKDSIIIEDIMEITGKYRNNFNVISACSSGLQDFTRLADSLAGNFKVFSAMSNSCSARKMISDSISVGFVGYPVCGHRNALDGHCEEYSCDENCPENSFCSCIHIFEINIDERQTYEGNKTGVKVDKRCFYRHIDQYA